VSEDGSSAHVVLSDAQVDRIGSPRLRTFASGRGLGLFLIDGDDAPALLRDRRRCKQRGEAEEGSHADHVGGGGEEDATVHMDDS